MAKHSDPKLEMKTITLSEIDKLKQQELSVRIQSNDLVFVGKKIKIMLREMMGHGVLREDVYRLIAER
ncbi:MAG: hypothetical protein V4525_01570 [Pseudomonadota bacterium]